jgi:beta-lactamase class A
MPKTLCFIFLAITLLNCSLPFSLQAKNKDQFRRKIYNVIIASKAQVGIGISGLDFKDSLTINNNHRYPMQSVYKFPLALAILQWVDEKKQSLNEKIHVPQQSLDTATWSPMVKDFPAQDIDITLRDLLIYTVSKSDNNACDILFRLAGGTAKVNSYIHSLGIHDIMIAATEAEMRRGWQVQYRNWCKPTAMLQLLRQFYNGQLLSKSSGNFLMKIMTESENSPKRIKGLLPEQAVVAHKTGTSNTNQKGIIAATNDAGIITLPNGRHVALVVYVSDYKTGVANGEQIIAQIARIIWDYYSEK